MLEYRIWEYEIEHCIVNGEPWARYICELGSFSVNPIWKVFPLDHIAKIKALKISL